MKHSEPVDDSEDDDDEEEEEEEEPSASPPKKAVSQKNSAKTARPANDDEDDEAKRKTSAKPARRAKKHDDEEEDDEEDEEEDEDDSESAEPQKKVSRKTKAKSARPAKDDDDDAEEDEEEEDDDDDDDEEEASEPAEPPPKKKAKRKTTSKPARRAKDDDEEQEASVPAEPISRKAASGKTTAKPASQANAGSSAAASVKITSPPLMVSGCQNETISDIIAGTYLPDSVNHGKVVYKKSEKSRGLDVLIYFWDDRDGPELCGWWFGPNIGGDQVWAYHPSMTASTPPASKWNIPHDGAIDQTFSVSVQINKPSAQPVQKTGAARKSKGEAPAQSKVRSRAGTSTKENEPHDDSAGTESKEAPAKAGAEAPSANYFMEAYNRRKEERAKAQEELRQKDEGKQDAVDSAGTGGGDEGGAASSSAPRSKDKDEEAKNKQIEDMKVQMGREAEEEKRQMEAIKRRAEERRKRENLLKEQAKQKAPEQEKTKQKAPEQREEKVRAAEKESDRKADRSRDRDRERKRADEKKREDDKDRDRKRRRDESDEDDKDRDRKRRRDEDDDEAQKDDRKANSARRKEEEAERARRLEKEREKKEEERKKKEDEMRRREEEVQKKREERKQKEEHEKRKADESRRALEKAERDIEQMKNEVKRRQAEEKEREEKERIRRQELEKQQEEELRKKVEAAQRNAMDEKKRREEEAKVQRQQKATLTVLKVLQKMSNAGLENFDAIKKEFEATLASDLPETGAQQDILRAEADRVREYAEKFVAQVREQENKWEVAAKLRACTGTQGDKLDDLYDAIAGAGGRVTRSTIKAYLKTHESDIEAEKLESLWPKSAAPVNGGAAVEEDETTISRESFMRVVRVFYKVVKGIVLTDKLLIEQSTQLRRMDVGEVMEVFEGPTIDPSVGVYRVHGRALRDGMMGWVTVAGNGGIAFLMPSGNLMRVARTTRLTDSVENVEGESVRQLREGEVLEVISWERIKVNTPSAVTRIQAKVKGEDAVGWASMTEEGIANLEVV
eukprot:TRINITY_DN17987_c0_g1_i2.p1 TRINITY_DN17987_c0_g1~~TRINITY_DN17987_c0_g1_i2.p1  ORF type:complete len:1018 (+),score=328.89 TRINITY_DN17987_c0_g1_i2:57-3110(+)